MITHKCYYINKVWIIVAFLSTLMVTSCVKEPICGTDTEHEKPHYTGVTFKCDMSNLKNYFNEDSLPHHVQIIANRLIYAKMTNIYYSLDSLNGHFLNSEDDTVTVAKTNTVTTDSLSTDTISTDSTATDSLTTDSVNTYTRFPLEQGQYRFYTVYTDMKTFDMSPLKSYMDKGKVVTIGGHFVTAKTFERDSVGLKEILERWTDYNRYKNVDSNYVKFLNSMEEPLLIDSTDITTLPKNDSITVKFAPKSISHNIDVYFDIKKKTDELAFTIDSVYCVFSGIPSKVDIGTGALDLSLTNKLLTKMILVSTGSVPTVKSDTLTDTSTSTLVRCFKNINILGMTDNYDMHDDRFLGPGVMQVMVYATVYDRSGGRQRTVTGLINMHNALSTAKLQQYDALHNVYKRSRDHTVMPILIDLEIGKDMLLGDDTGGIPQWKKETFNGTDEMNVY